MHAINKNLNISETQTGFLILAFEPDYNAISNDHSCYKLFKLFNNGGKLDELKFGQDMHSHSHNLDKRQHLYIQDHTQYSD